MCGIGAVISDKEIGKFGERFAKGLLYLLQERGTDAFGFFARNEQQNYLYKIPLSVEEFIKAEGTIRLENFYLVIMHTRATTRGSKIFNKNNHPFYYGDAVLVHNGSVSVKAQDYEIPDRVETDSIQILISYLKERDISQAITQNDNPTIILHDTKKNITYFNKGKNDCLHLGEVEYKNQKFIILASEKEMIERVSEALQSEFPHKITFQDIKGCNLITKDLKVFKLRKRLDLKISNFVNISDGIPNCLKKKANEITKALLEATGKNNFNDAVEAIFEAIENKNAGIFYVQSTGDLYLIVEYEYYSSILEDLCKFKLNNNYVIEINRENISRLRDTYGSNLKKERKWYYAW